MEFRLEGNNPFEFSRSEIERQLNVWLILAVCYVKVLLPDSYSGYGIHVQYRLVAKGKSVIPSIRAEQIVQTKEAVGKR